MPAVARAFDYLVPTSLAERVRVGAVVRVPLHGRRVRGWVVADGVAPEAAPERLVALAGVVSAGPSPDLVALAEWAAWRWAGPATVFLRAASPPNTVPPDDVAPRAAAEPAVRAVAREVAAPPTDLGGAWPDVPVRVVTWPPGADRRLLVRSLVAPEGSTLVLVPEPARAGVLVRSLIGDGRTVLHHHSDRSDRERTAIWDEARRGDVVVVGGRASVWLPLPDLRAVVVLDESDEAFQDERAPTWHARDVAVERAARARCTISLVSPAPSPDAWATGGAGVVPPSRALRAGWPLLEVVDLRSEPPGSTLLAHPLGPAIHRALDSGGRALCIVNRRGRARLLACRACRALARCEVCGAAVTQPEHDLVCPRCARTRPPVCGTCGATRFRAVRPGVHGVRDEVAALVPRVEVAEVDAGTVAIPDVGVLVGTEAVLHRVARGGDHPVRLVAFLAFDEELLAPRSRAHEQALWLLVRAARLLGPRTAGGRLLVQTRLPDHPVLAVAATGDPTAFTAAETEVRIAIGSPPFGGMAELSGEPAALVAAAEAIRAAGLVVLGPTGGRALVRAPDAEALADGLARADLVGARARGRLRVRVDPARA